MVQLSSSDEVLRLYTSLMAELKYRLSWIRNQVAPFGDAPAITITSIEIDSWYLQLRRVTELFALAVLVAHNTNERFQQKTYVREYNPDKLIDAMVKASPAAFPRKCNRPIDMHGRHGAIMIVELVETPNPDAPDKVREMYQVCCDKLHMGPLRGVVRSREKERKFTFIRDSSRWLVELLNRHFIVTPNGFNIYGELDFGVTDDAQVFCRYSDNNAPLRPPPLAPQQPQ